ncbi:hypothetical protein VTL71DRAFT_13920 [Oculimacula yallundae]|uniref:Uncharacterized protein n=1 Tax=Oculimacula yallundae TaxID=86028 RepID=A0ABR4CP97_9HELO
MNPSRSSFAVSGDLEKQFPAQLDMSPLDLESALENKDNPNFSMLSSKTSCDIGNDSAETTCYGKEPALRFKWLCLNTIWNYAFTSIWIMILASHYCFLQEPIPWKVWWGLYGLATWVVLSTIFSLAMMCFYHERDCQNHARGKEDNFRNLGTGEISFEEGSREETGHGEIVKDEKSAIRSTQIAAGER